MIQNSLTLPFEFLNQKSELDKLWLLFAVRLIELSLLLLWFKEKLFHFIIPKNGLECIFQISTGILISLFGFLIVWGVDYFGVISIFEMLRNESLEMTRSYFYALLICGALLAPFVEELFFRACLLGIFTERKWSYVLHHLAAGILFVLPHINFSIELTRQWGNIFIWSCCSFLMILLFVWRRSIIPGYIVHACANAVLFSLSFNLI